MTKVMPTSKEMESNAEKAWSRDEMTTEAEKNKKIHQFLR